MKNRKETEEKDEESISEIQDNFKWPVIQVIGVPEVGRGNNNNNYNNRNNGQKFKENYKLIALKIQQNPSIRNMKKTKVHHNEIVLIKRFQ